MSLEHMVGEGNTSPEGLTGGVAVAEKIPGSTTTRVQELVKPPSVGILGRFFGRPGSQIPEESTVEEVEKETTPEPEVQPAAGGAGNGSEGRSGDGGRGGGSGPERPGGPEGENPESKNPNRIARNLQVMDRQVERMADMDPRAKENLIREYQRNADIFTKYYNDNKIFDADHPETFIKEELEKFDKDWVEEGREIEKLHLSGADAEALRGLLQDLDAAEEEKQRVDNILALKETKQERNLFDRKGWEEQQIKRDKLADRVMLLQGEIRRDEQYSNFLTKRYEKKAKIETDIKAHQAKKKEQDRQKIREIFGDPDIEVEAGLIDKEQKDEKITLTPEEEQNLRPFSEASAALKVQEELRRKKSPDFSQTEYDRAKKEVGYYFQEAEGKRVFYDLKKELGQDFESYMRALGFWAPESPYDRVQPRSFTGVRDEVTANANQINQAQEQDILAQTELESEETWNELEEMAKLDDGDRNRFQGIRAEYMRRAYERMRIVFTNLDHLQDRLNLATRLMRDQISMVDYRNEMEKIHRDLIRESINGEWNFGAESREKRKLETRVFKEQGEQLFRITDYGLIELNGKNSWDLEKGAEQAADFIIRSAATYSLEAVQQKRQLLIEAITRRENIFKAESATKEDSDKLMDRIKRIALNKLDFYILHWLAQNLRMDEYAGYFEQMVQQDGVDRLKVIPSMGNGLVGLAIHFLNQPEYRLFFRPAGFRNQLNKSGAQGALRDKLKEQLVEKLMGFEIIDADEEGRQIPAEERWKLKAESIQDLMKVQSTDKFLGKFGQKGELPEGKTIENLTEEEFGALETGLTPKQKLEFRQQQHKKAIAESKAKPGDQEALFSLRETRELLAFEHKRYQRVEEDVKNAVDEAVKVMDIFGESAEIGQASIVMDNRDRIPIECAKLVNKFAILEAAKAYGDTNKVTVVEDGKSVIYRVEDNIGNMRRRSMEWQRRWVENGHFWDENKHQFLIQTDDPKILPFRNFGVELKDGIKTADGRSWTKEPTKLNFTLQKGFEETGLTVEEWQSLEKFAGILRKDGFAAKFSVIKRDKNGESVKVDGQVQMEEVSFWDIIKMDELQPVLSNFVADYKSSGDQMEDDYLREQAALGRLEGMQSILGRFEYQSGIKGTVGGDNYQDRLNKYTDLITDSTEFDQEVENLVFLEAVHGLKTQQQKVVVVGKDGAYQDSTEQVFPTSTARIDYGYNGLPWGKKRQQDLRSFWYTNERRVIQRAEDTVWFMPVYSYSLKKESAAPTMMQLFWDLNRLEKDDNWTLMTYGQRVKDVQAFKRKAEGDLVIEGTNSRKDWGYLEKPLTDTNSLRGLFRMLRPKTTPEEIRQELEHMSPAEREEVINKLFEITFGGRFAPLVNIQERQSSVDRQALASGLGYDNNMKFAYRFVTRWLYSAKAGDTARTEGGIEAYREAETILRLILDSNSYIKKEEKNGKTIIEGASLFDELWRKLIPSHNARIRYSVQEPTYKKIAV